MAEIVQMVAHQTARTAVEQEGAEVRDYRPGRASAEVCIIIPARDEAEVLPTSLRSLLRQEFAGVMRLIISDNGSSDATVEVARSWGERFEQAGHEVWVLHLPFGNKPAALNAADVVAGELPRVYLDADIELSPNCLTEIVAALTAGGGVLMCCPEMRIARNEGWVARKWGRVWTQLPWVAEDAIGGGVYAVSGEGRKRWQRYPNIVAEDAFVQVQFRRSERRVLHNCYFLIRLPDAFNDLVSIRTRQLRGNRELSQHTNGDWGRKSYPLLGRLKFVAGSPKLWPYLPVYFFVNMWALMRARRRAAVGTKMWERAAGRAAGHAENSKME
jgi:glycosyltransferase involved in cell wall biosynthesis